MGDMVAVRFQPQRAEIAVERGVTVLDAAMNGKVSLPHKCGGHGSCGTCKVVIDSKTGLALPNPLELRHLTETRLAEGFRLACQCVLTGPATVTVPEDPLRRVVRELIAMERERQAATSVEEREREDAQGAPTV